MNAWWLGYRRCPWTIISVWSRRLVLQRIRFLGSMVSSQAMGVKNMAHYKQPESNFWDKNCHLRLFTGTAGVWRMDALRDAGGWKDRTTVEDMDLAVRASLRGWEFLYLGDLAVSTIYLNVDMNSDYLIYYSLNNDHINKHSSCRWRMNFQVHIKHTVTNNTDGLVGLLICSERCLWRYCTVRWENKANYLWCQAIYHQIWGFSLINLRLRFGFRRE